jgi:O-antigen/teichoic acid export membrane protein
LSEDAALERAKARKRSITKTAAASIAAKAISIAVTLVSVPLTLGYLGAERFGMWMVLSSFTLLMSFLDLGVGNSTINALASSSGTNVGHELRVKISSAYAVTWIMAAMLLLLLLPLSGLIPWAKLFNVTSPLATSEAGPAATTFFIVLALATPLNLIYRIHLGLQQGFRASMWQGVGSIIALASLYFATSAEASLPWLVLSLSGVPTLVALVSACHFFLYSHPDLCPSFKQIDRSMMRTLLSGGLSFLILQICAALMFQSNAIVIAQLMGAADVATFTIAERLFGLISFILGLLLVPLWPAYGEALANRDDQWIKRTFRQSLVYSAILATVLSCIFVILSPLLIDWWIGGSIVVPFTVLLGFGIWKVIEAIGNAVAILLNGLNVIGLQAALAVINTIANLALKIWMVDRFGLSGVMFATILAYSVFALPWLAFLVRRALRQ